MWYADCVKNCLWTQPIKITISECRSLFYLHIEMDFICRRAIHILNIFFSNKYLIYIYISYRYKNTAVYKDARMDQIQNIFG